MSSVRLEFTTRTKKAALARSGGLCEASGPFYNRSWDERCGASLVKVEYDHFILASEGGTRELYNCRAVCPECHSWKTRFIDTPKAAKAKRLRRNADPETRRQTRHPIRNSGRAIPARPFPKRKTP